MSQILEAPADRSRWRGQSVAPDIRLVNRFDRAFDGVVAAARTCYSGKGIVTPGQVAGDGLGDEAERSARLERRDRLAGEIYLAGHHTTYQHAHVQYAMSNVSRLFIWSFLHAHPFYNSEQVSQRYVEVKDGNFHVPEMDGRALEVYLSTVARQTEAYRRLNELLIPATEAEYVRIFPGRARTPDKVRRDVKKKTQEIARYVLPVATFAFMYHTVSVLTLFRYYRLCEMLDTPLEQRFVVQQMVDALLREEPDYRRILEEPLPHEETLEAEALAALQPESNRSFRREFDLSLDGRVSRLIDWKVNAIPTLAAAVREVLGVESARLTDDDAVRMVLDPSHNHYLSESLVLTTISKVTRALHHAHYTFRKKISHTADSQDQRHRMTPASRPVVHAYLTEEPDFIIPDLVLTTPEAEDLYRRTMDQTWTSINELRSLGVAATDAAYLLPNAVSIRMTESSDLLNLHHKHKMRLCYNAQEEIFRASLDEALQIRELHPAIGRYLLPPCTPRKMAGTRPICPEGSRFCGVAVWNLDPAEYQRLL